MAACNLDGAEHTTRPSNRESGRLSLWALCAKGNSSNEKPSTRSSEPSHQANQPNLASADSQDGTRSRRKKEDIFAVVFD
jgi:hypothetical protein